jgi:hypothetical protein
MECHMFPWIIAEAVFDTFAGDWVVKGPDVIAAALELHDQEATDDQITTELFSFPLSSARGSCAPLNRPDCSFSKIDFPISIWLHRLGV